MSNAPVTTMTTPEEREFQLTDADFSFLSGFVTRHTGIKLTEGKRELVYGRLARRLRQLNLGSFSAYCEMLRGDPGDELGHLVNAITTNLTSFFRERHHFEYLAGKVLPALQRANAATRRIRIWSAGCSTGAEPYSLAMTVREAPVDLRGWDVKILATDIDTNVLQVAANGVYVDKELEGLSREQLRRWFLRGTGANGGRARAKDELRDMLTFRPLNLMEPWPVKGPIDVLFCRNVVIYFDKETQKTLFNRFADVLAPDSHLFIGHSESLFKVCERFELIGQTIYRRLG
jgi:chemotaxis protein methyltransferase CheR